MAFEGLTSRLQEVFKKLRSKGKITQDDLDQSMRELKIVLLEADVNFKLVKEFIGSIKDKALGSDTFSSLTPAQQIIKIVNEELIELMGSVETKISFSNKPPTVIMLTGLQGVGKTTACGKLAVFFKKQGKQVLLVACDVYRPAAIKQLKVMGVKSDVNVFSMDDVTDPVVIASEAKEWAIVNSVDVVIVDTAGRLHMDDALMTELVNLKKVIKPSEIIFTMDAMTGQAALDVAQVFEQRLGIDGIIITKMDGDARGGAALSAKSITGKPIKFVSQGEKVSDFDIFYPDRMASRILGMGDVLSLIDKVQQSFDKEQAYLLDKKLRASNFTLQDFLEQLQQVKKMGSLKDIIGMLPGVSDISLGSIDDKAMVHVEAIIKSMTVKERDNPSIITGSRKRRIA